MALAGGLVYFAWGHLSHQTGSLSEPESTSAKPERARIYLGPARSIAVLPFTGEPELQTGVGLSYGFSRELHRLITRAPGLLVTSDNSSFFFRDRSVPMPIIAERLQTRFLLFGEALFSDQQVRVEATLFDGKLRKERWSQVYEGSMQEVFAIQNQILADTIALVSPGRQFEAPKATPIDTQAWTKLLEGVFYQSQRNSTAYDHAEQAFLTALEIEPEYTNAQIGLAEVWLAKNALGAADHDLVESARQTLDTVLQLDPDSATALGLLSYIRRDQDWDWQGALEAAEKAVQLSPGDPELMSTASLAMFSLGQFGQADELLRRSVSQDPLNLVRRLQLGLLQEFAGQNDAALNSYRVIIGLNPEFPGVRAYRARIKIIQDKPESALLESNQEVDPFWKRYSQILAYAALERDQDGQLLLDQMIDDDGDHSAYQIAEIMAFRGEIDLAFEWLQLAYEQKDGGMSEIIGNFFLRQLHADPRWADLLSLLGLPGDVSID